MAYPEPFAGYGADSTEMPLDGYAVLLAAYAGIFGTLLGWQVSRSRPRPVALADVVVLGVATHKIGRIVTKDWVTSPLRAPFTEYVESRGGGEVRERARGTGVRRAVGDLLTCPWCIAPWVAGGLYSVYLASPRAGRLAGSLFASVTVSDFLQHAYDAVMKRT